MPLRLLRVPKPGLGIAARLTIDCAGYSLQSAGEAVATAQVFSHGYVSLGRSHRISRETNRVPIKAVVFDAFGTILRIQDGIHPYRPVMREGRRQGRRPRPDDPHQIMTLNLDLAGIAEHFGIKMSAPELSLIQADLDEEVMGIQAFPDASDADLITDRGRH